mgnify:CR=1 FL=1
MTNLYFFKDDERAIIPTKRKEDAGYDVYMLPTDEPIIVKPGETVMLHTGLKSAFSSDYVLLGRERGSTGTRGLRFGAGVIDSGFRGEILIPINNTSDKEIVLMPKEYSDDNSFEDALIYPQTKAIGQLLLVPVIDAEVREVSADEYAKFDSERGEGMLGSSGK